MEFIKEFGGLAGAIMAILGLAAFVVRPIRKFIRDHEAADLEQSARLERLERHQRETWLATLRLSIFNETLILGERVTAGEAYIQNGGNGAARIQHENNLARLKKEMHGDG